MFKYLWGLPLFYLEVYVVSKKNMCKYLWDLPLFYLEVYVVSKKNMCKYLWDLPLFYLEVYVEPLLFHHKEHAICHHSPCLTNVPCLYFQQVPTIQIYALSYIYYKVKKSSFEKEECMFNVKFMDSMVNSILKQTKWNIKKNI